MAENAPSIPILIAWTPYTHAAGEDGDQTLHRGGLIQIGTANPAAGGGAVYVAICSGALLEFDPATGHATPISPAPTTYGPKNYVRFDGTRAATQPGFDWINLGGDSPAFLYSCMRTDS